MRFETLAAMFVSGSLLLGALVAAQAARRLAGVMRCRVEVRDASWGILAAFLGMAMIALGSVLVVRSQGGGPR